MIDFFIDLRRQMEKPASARIGKAWQFQRGMIHDSSAKSRNRSMAYSDLASATENPGVGESILPAAPPRVKARGHGGFRKIGARFLRVS
jgi:hypothetical protein